MYFSSNYRLSKKKLKSDDDEYIKSNIEREIEIHEHEGNPNHTIIKSILLQGVEYSKGDCVYLYPKEDWHSYVNKMRDKFQEDWHTHQYWMMQIDSIWEVKNTRHIF